MGKVSKIKIFVITLIFILLLLTLLVISFFAGYTVFISMIASLVSKTLSLPAVVVGIFLIQLLGLLTMWSIKKLINLYKDKTGMKIIRNK
ncbi:hypothetical protein ACY2DA_13465 [Staphylococcus simulans]|nr:hypothetical protein [Staphylococcus aureus]